MNPKENQPEHASERTVHEVSVKLFAKHSNILSTCLRTTA